LSIVERNDKLLLVKRKKDPFKGLLSFPGGKVDLGEKVEDAVKRDLWEETNLDIEPTDTIRFYDISLLVMLDRQLKKVC
jgi:8-oxo-dGTP diphosphatase